MAQQILENVGHEHVVIELLRELFEKQVILVAVYGFVDLGKVCRQIVQFLLQPGKITVHRMQLLPELRLKPKDMILAGRPLLEKSPDDHSLSVPIRQRGADEVLFDAFHVSLSLVPLRFDSQLFGHRTSHRNFCCLSKLKLRTLNVATPDIDGATTRIDNRLMSGIVETA